ncbi:MAG: hypothetical protein LC674_02030, partial [Actinobacteria bacterium]|nr:hypothetical protein [Actinomycetota bacterium]
YCPFRTGPVLHYPSELLARKPQTFVTFATYTPPRVNTGGGVMRLLLVIIAALLFSATAYAASGHQVDLATGDLDGKQILGGSFAEVTAALGKPDFAGGPRSRRLVGWGGNAGSFKIAVLFRPVGRRLVARTLVFERGSIHDMRIGELLSPAPRSLQAKMRSSYADEFKLVRPYRCRTAGLCTGEFRARDAELHITFGRTARRGTFVTIWTPQS